MYTATLEEIKNLRQLSGAGVGNVKEALEASEGDLDKAIAYLREKGLAKANKRAGKEIANGYIGKYIHDNGRLVVAVEVGCETDFAANSKEFMDFANKLALHIAASNPRYVAEDRVPANIVDVEKAAFAKDVEGKPAEVAEKILAGKLDKFYAETVLTRQEMFGGNGETVADAMNELVAKIGEKIEIGKMVKMHIGGETIIDIGA
jgi:elongation factor Ts